MVGSDKDAKITAQKIAKARDILSGSVLRILKAAASSQLDEFLIF